MSESMPPMGEPGPANVPGAQPGVNPTSTGGPGGGASSGPWTAPGAAPATPPGEIPKDDKTIATLTHLSAILNLLVIGPLIVWILKKDTSPYLNDQAKEALNFHISLLIYHLVMLIGSFFLCFIPTLAVMVFGVVFAILAAIASNKGEYYRYPMCLRFIK